MVKRVQLFYVIALRHEKYLGVLGKSAFLLLLTTRFTEEFYMSKSDVFHLGLTKNDLQGPSRQCPSAILSVEKIAALMDKLVLLASTANSPPAR